MNNLYFQFDGAQRNFKVSLLDPDPAHEAGNRPTAQFNLIYILGLERVVLPIESNDFLRISLAIVQATLEESALLRPPVPVSVTPAVPEAPKVHRHRHCEVCLTPICKIVEARERREAGQR